MPSSHVPVSLESHLSSYNRGVLTFSAACILTQEVKHPRRMGPHCYCSSEWAGLEARSSPERSLRKCPRDEDLSLLGQSTYCVSRLQSHSTPLPLHNGSVLLVVWHPSLSYHQDPGLSIFLPEEQMSLERSGIFIPDRKQSFSNAVPSGAQKGYILSDATILQCSNKLRLY